jgi:hypothetical protein
MIALDGNTTMNRCSTIAVFLALVVPLVGCGGPRQDPLETWQELKEALAEQDYSAVLGLMPPAHRRAITEWGIHQRAAREREAARGNPGELEEYAGRLRWTVEKLREATPEELGPRHLPLTIHPMQEFHYIPDFVKHVEVATKDGEPWVEYPGPDLAVVHGRHTDADPEDETTFQYRFVLVAGRWYWWRPIPYPVPEID